MLLIIVMIVSIIVITSPPFSCMTRILLSLVTRSMFAVRIRDDALTFEDYDDDDDYPDDDNDDVDDDEVDDDNAYDDNVLTFDSCLTRVFFHISV